MDPGGWRVLPLVFRTSMCRRKYPFLTLTRYKRPPLFGADPFQNTPLSDRTCSKQSLCIQGLYCSMHLSLNGSVRNTCCDNHAFNMLLAHPGGGGGWVYCHYWSVSVLQEEFFFWANSFQDTPLSDRTLPPGDGHYEFVMICNLWS